MGGWRRVGTKERRMNTKPSIGNNRKQVMINDIYNVTTGLKKNICKTSIHASHESIIKHRRSTSKRESDSRQGSDQNDKL